MPRKSVTVTRTRARLRVRMSAASTPLNRVLTGTSTAPAWNRPSTATTHSALLNAQMATRSPGSMPDATSAAPNVRACVEQLGVGQPGVAVDDGGLLAEPVGGGGGHRRDARQPLPPARSSQDRVLDVHQPGEVAAHDLADGLVGEARRARRRSSPGRPGPRDAGSRSRTARGRRR